MFIIFVIVLSSLRILINMHKCAFLIYQSKAKNREIVTTIFLHNIPDSAKGHEIWKLYQECGQIKDIILPRKRDRSRKRFGFIKTTTEREAGAIISNAKMDRKLGSKIKMTINNSKEMGKGVERPKRSPVVEDHNPTPKTVPENQEEIPFEKKMFEFIEAEIDEEVEEVLMGSKIGYTWFDMETNQVQEIIEDTGLGKYKVISLSKRKFLIRKNLKDSWHDLDKTDLSVWFCLIRNYEETDHVLSRVVWLECRSLPMPAWREENLRAFTDRLGKWISWSYQSDGLNDFFNPLICLDTVNWSSLNDTMTILYKGNKREVQFVEVKDEGYLQGKVMPMEFSQDEGNREKKTDVGLGKQEEDRVERSEKEEGDFSQVDQNISSDIGENSQKDKKMEKALVEFKGREIQTQLLCDDYRQTQTSTEKETTEKELLSESNKSTICAGKSNDDLDNSQSTLCEGMSKKLRVKSNRGRPRKKMLQQRNPFDIGKKLGRKRGAKATTRNRQNANRKAVNNGSLQIVPKNMIGSTVQEALEILASAENMGLTISGDRSRVVRELAIKLNRKEL